MKKITEGKILLINPNSIKPLVGPIGIDYLVHYLKRKRFKVNILDLAFFSEHRSAIRQYFQDSEADVVGISVRNTDDCYFASQDFFIPRIKELVGEVKRWTDAPVVLGGAGFSIMPQRIVEFCGADFGIKGEGEKSLAELARSLVYGEEYTAIPGLIYHSQNSIRSNRPSFLNLNELDYVEREAVNNERYFIEGGQGNIETKRGCDKRCIYCADPAAKGKKIRLRSPQSIVSEIESLLARGINCFHFCDSEFNNPVSHALSICEEIIGSGLSKQIKWYTYACPVPFSKDLALMMKKAGCVGIDFGVDSGNDTMLTSLGRDFVVQDIARTARICHTVGITFMYDLLLGGPGETRETVKETIMLMKELGPHRVGVSLGVRIYPGTKLAEIANSEGVSTDKCNLSGWIENNEDFLRPIFYLSSEMGGDISIFLTQIIDGDKRFLFANPEHRDQNYNYNENEVLVEAIRNGYRGAYWDILRQLSGG